MRAAVFLAVFFLFWITTTPFVDLRDPAVLLPKETGSPVEQACVLAAAAAAVAVLVKRREAAALVFSPALACVLAWQVVSVATSTRVDLSVRRFALSLFALVIAAALPLIPRDEAQFGRLLAIGAGAVLLVAYAGVAFWPEVSVHNLAEVLELDNAGSWRGHFEHKNIAGAAMVILIIYGVYLARRVGAAVGVPIVLLAAAFLAESGNKTSTALVALAFALAELTRRARSLRVQACLTVLPVAATWLFTVGSVLFEPVGTLVAAVASDPTFTNRTMIWRFALDSLAQRPLFGYGFAAFWSTSSLVDGGGAMETAAVNAGHAHDAYLNVALFMGLPGAALVCAWLLWQPLKDFHAGQAGANDPALGLMHLRAWLFLMLYSCLESPFFAARGPIWFSLLVAVFGLRLHARAAQAAAPRAAPAGRRATAGGAGTRPSFSGPIP